MPRKRKMDDLHHPCLPGNRAGNGRRKHKPFSREKRAGALIVNIHYKGYRQLAVLSTFRISENGRYLVVNEGDNTALGFLDKHVACRFMVLCRQLLRQVHLEDRGPTFEFVPSLTKG
jgi:hypothetical protein